MGPPNKGHALGKRESKPMIAKYGGRHLTKGGSHKLPEGGHWRPVRVVIVEFPDMAASNAWCTAPEYQPLVALRKQCTSDLDMLFTLEGAKPFLDMPPSTNLQSDLQRTI
jgi:uncharacterized protein (DUF1330 family)